MTSSGESVGNLHTSSHTPNHASPPEMHGSARLRLLYVAAFVGAIGLNLRPNAVITGLRGSGVPSPHVAVIQLPPVQSQHGPPFEAREECPNYFIASSEGGGIGHRMSAIAMALALTEEAGVALMLDDALADMPRLQDSATYPYFRRLFNLYAFPTPKELGVVYGPDKTTPRFLPTILGNMTGTKPSHVQHAVMLATTGCGQVIEVRTGHREACKGPMTLNYCVKVGIPGAYQRAREVLWRLYAEGPYARLPLVHFRETVGVSAWTPTLAVLWYVRNDDVKLLGGKEGYWRRLVEDVTTALGAVPAHHYVMSQNPIKPEDPSFGFLHRIEGWTWTALSGLSVPDAMYHMVAADVLVHSGSSFSLAAGVAAPHSQVALFPRPKESDKVGDGPWQTYWLDGSIPVGDDGALTDGDKLRLVSAAKRRLRQRPAQWAVPMPKDVLTKKNP